MAHTFDNNLRFVGNTSPLTAAYTCGADARLLVVGVTYQGYLRGGGAPTYNGVALTQADETRLAVGNTIVGTQTVNYYISCESVSYTHLTLPTTPYV